MFATNHTKRLLSAAVSSLVLLTLPAMAVDAKGEIAPEITMTRGSLELAETLGVNRIFRSEKGFPGFTAAKDVAKSLWRASGLKADLELKYNESGSALTATLKEDPSAYFRMDTRTGDFSFSKGLAKYSDPSDTKGLPGKNEAIDLALAHLERLGLMPKDGNQLVVQAVGGVGMSAQDEKGNLRDFEKLTSVHFGRQIDGIDVGGPGSKIVVHLGQDGELVGLHKRWIELQSMSKVSRESFLQEAEIKERALKHLQTEWNKASKIVTALPEPGYFDDGKGHIEPVYFVQAQIQHVQEGGARDGENQDPAPYLGVIPALRYSVADLRQLAPATKAPDLDAGANVKDRRDTSDE
ncbi:hypothetical protein G3480_21890 [Thiorhodococcus mannitoliphagus]|uniref:Uncharacterized protein n=1 Tax=Thiorhodococcus mannitoliphagus TaxID=329406 RepID=A0A6P1DZK5_9GAMM|nr:hypothetical protein [Thiorhodococcus mannitoliphagus]NEX22920.1 hypothetical protein [Thiorhodococcus mannitoliphagus]